MNRQGYLFEYSRNPVEVLLAGAADPPRWFENHAVPATQRVLRSLRAHRDVRRADLDVIEHTARDELGNYSSFLITLRLDLRGQKPIAVDGSGHARGRDLARVIALAELFERLSIHINFGVLAGPAPVGRATKPAVGDWGGNGTCFHSSAVRVVKGALCELLERDAFLTNWYSGRGLPQSRIDRSHPLFRLATRLGKLGWRLAEHYWRHDQVDAACVYLSVIREQPIADGWNFFLGGGAAPTHREAIAKATSEVLRLFRSWQASYDVVDHSEQVSASALGNVASRLLVYQRPSYVREFERMTSERPRATNHALPARSDRAFVIECIRALGDVQIVPLPVPTGLRDHVFCIKAVSKRLQNIDWMMPPNFNVTRIKARYGTSPVRFNRFPHPIA